MLRLEVVFSPGREALGLFGEKMEEQLRAAASQEPLLREAGEATQGWAGAWERWGGSSQDSVAPRPVENYRPSPDLEYDETRNNKEEAAGNDGEKELLWSPTEPATPRELTRLGARPSQGGESRGT